MTDKMKILLLDIETAPHKVYVWDLFDKYINTERVIDTASVLCWSAKWFGEDEIQTMDAHHGKVAMLNVIRGLLHEADAVVHYNGTKFDIPKLNKEFVECEMSPPSPYRQVDLYRVIKQHFKFASNKLTFITEQLGMGKKANDGGFQTWVKAMEGDAKAMAQLVAYNKQDVLLLEKLYKRLLPWIDLHPNHAVHSGVDSCPSCGSTNFQARGTQVTANQRYARFQCQDCGKWFRGSKPLNGKRDIGTRNVRP